MGGGASKKARAPAGAPPPQQTIDDDTDSTPDDSPAVSPQPDDQRRRSKSAQKLVDMSKERHEDEDDAPEMFLWGDFVVDVKEATKKQEKPKRNPRQPPKPKPKPSAASGDDDAAMFSFGDFTVSTDGDEDLPTAGLPKDSRDQRPKKELHEYHIKSYQQYSLIGHPTRVKCICVAPSELFLISCSNEDAAMTMSDIHTGKEILSFMGHEDTIISACFSSDTKYLATTSRDNTMILWDVTTGKQMLTFEHEKVVICCCFSRDAKYLVSGCQDKVCRVWETKKGREVVTFMEHEGIIISVSFTPSGESVVSASADKTLKIWRTRDAACVHTLRGHSGIVLSSAYRSDGQFIVSNDEKVLKVWDAGTGQCTLSLSVDEVPRANSLPGKKQTWTLSSYCPGTLGFYIIAACNSRTVHIFHPESGVELLALCCKAPVYCLSSGTDSKVAFGDSYGNVCVVILHAS